MEKFDLQKETIILQAERIINDFNSLKYVDWAIKAMQNGYESDNLCVIAGCDNELSEIVDSYFDRAKKDLDLDLNLDDSTIVNIYAEQIINEIINESINPEKGLSILVKIDEYLESDTRYNIFSEIAYDIDYLKFDNYTIYIPNLSLDNVNKYIIDECKLLMQFQDIQISDEMKDFVYCMKCYNVGIPTFKRRTFFSIKATHPCCSKCKSSDIRSFNSRVGRKEIYKYLIK